MPPPTSAIFMGCGRSSTSGLSAKAERVLPRPVSTSFRTGRCSISPAGRRWISSPMSELADRERLRKQHWAAPGGSHDNVVRLLKLALPVLIGALMAYLALAPLSKNPEISFILDKNKVALAKERQQDEAARYPGPEHTGRPLTIPDQS